MQSVARATVTPASQSIRAGACGARMENEAAGSSTATTAACRRAAASSGVAWSRWSALAAPTSAASRAAAGAGQLLGVEAGPQALLQPGAQHPARLLHAEGPPVAEHIAVAGQGGAGGQHLPGDQVQVVLPVHAPGHHVGPQEGGHHVDGDSFPHRPGRLQDLHLGGRVEAVARLDLDGRGALAQQAPGPLRGRRPPGRRTRPPGWRPPSNGCRRPRPGSPRRPRRAAAGRTRPTGRRRTPGGCGRPRTRGPPPGRPRRSGAGRRARRAGPPPARPRPPARPGSPPRRRAPPPPGRGTAARWWPVPRSR